MTEHESAPWVSSRLVKRIPANHGLRIQSVEAAQAVGIHGHHRAGSGWHDALLQRVAQIEDKTAPNHTHEGSGQQ